MIGGLRNFLDTFLNYSDHGRCGAYLKIGPSTSHPLREVEMNLQAKQLNDPDTRSMVQDGRKNLLRIELKAKGDTEMETRNMKIIMGLGKSVTGLENSLKVQLGINKNKLLGLKDLVFCIMFQSNRSAEAEASSSDKNKKEHSVEGSASLSYGVGNSCRNTQTSTNIVFGHSSNFNSDKFLKRNYLMRINLSKSPPLVRSLLEKITTLFKVANLGHDTSKINVMKTNQLSSEIIVTNNKEVDVKIVTDSDQSYLKGVTIPPFLAQLSGSQGQESGTQRNQCEQTVTWVRTVDGLNITSSLSTCWMMLSGDCHEYPGLSVKIDYKIKKPFNFFRICSFLKKVGR